MRQFNNIRQLITYPISAIEFAVKKKTVKKNWVYPNREECFSHKLPWSNLLMSFSMYPYRPVHSVQQLGPYLARPNLWTQRMIKIFLIPRQVSWVKRGEHKLHLITFGTNTYVSSRRWESAYSERKKWVTLTHLINLALVPKNTHISRSQIDLLTKEWVNCGSIVDQ